MNKPRISAIAAIGENRELGKDNKLLWRIPEDLKRFKELTLGHPIIMGRKTFDSLGRLNGLPDRYNIIISRNNSFHKKGEFPNCFFVTSLDSALQEAETIVKKYFTQIKVTPKIRASLRRQQNKDASMSQNNGEIFIIGGGQIYKQAMPYIDRLYLTIVHNSFDADTFFPEYAEFTKVIEEEDHESREYDYTFVTLEK